MTLNQAVHWIGTMSKRKMEEIDWDFELLWAEGGHNIAYIKGQEEIGAAGFHHIQFYIAMKTKKTLNQMRKIFPAGLSPYLDPSISQAARDYVWKEETRVAGTQFELGPRILRWF